MLFPLLAAPFGLPLFWAVFIGWVMSVVVHEFCHGVVAHLGGDYTIRERGGLTLNPLQYIDPFGSIVLPIIFLMIGGVPLPGGVTYVRRDLLRSRWWDAAVSLAGPVSNLILFFLLIIPVHPAVRWVDAFGHPSSSPTGAFLLTLAQLQMIAVILNLIPVPPLDGFGVVGPFLDPDTRDRLSTPPVSTAAFVFLFVLIAGIPGFFNRIAGMTQHLLVHLGFGPREIAFLVDSYNYTLLGRM